MSKLIEDVTLQKMCSNKTTHIEKDVANKKNLEALP